MIRPASFSFNQETAGSNAFQDPEARNNTTGHKALDEFDHMVSLLEDNGVHVIVVDDTPDPPKPDAVFPNNWISFHETGDVVLYPMQAPNRRTERRSDIIDKLAANFTVRSILDLSVAESQGKFLEGTGSMVLDRDLKICYACVSPRTDTELVKEFCAKTGYTPVLFTARDVAGMLIYHTNVVMCVGEEFILVCLDAVSDKKEHGAIIKSTSKEIIGISIEQLHHFAGNMLEVKNTGGEHLLVMSEQAYSSLLPSQVAKLSRYARIVPVPLYTIEAAGGGSARCMMAEVFLPEKNAI